VVHRRTLPTTARDLGRLDPQAIEAVRTEARPHVRDGEELHELLLDLVLVPLEPPPLLAFLTMDLALQRELLESGRAQKLRVFGVEHLVPYEYVRDLPAAFGVVGTTDAMDAASSSTATATDGERHLDQLLRGYASVLGPFVNQELAAALGLPQDIFASAALRLETRGILLRGFFDPELPENQHCERRLLARIHQRTLSGLRRLIEPVSAQDTVRFLLRWQHVHPEHQRAGEAGLSEVIRKLAGWHAPLAAWESHLLSARMMKYERRMLDHLCLGGEVTFGRLRTESVGEQAKAHRQTPLSIWPPEAPPWWESAEGDLLRTRELSADAERVREELKCRGALFRSQIARSTGLVGAAVDEALKVLLAFGCVTCDGFAPLRRLVTPARRTHAPRGTPGGMPIADGRWSLLPSGPVLPVEDAAMALARQLLARYGVVCHSLLGREWLPMGWRAVRMALVRLEDRGEVRGGYIVSGMGGEHFALPDALERLREEARRPKAGEVFLLSPHDPLDLRGVIPGYGVRGLAGEGALRLIDGLPAPA
jgi:ATP-dependent Lhr-like helicase